MGRTRLKAFNSLGFVDTDGGVAECPREYALRIAQRIASQLRNKWPVDGLNPLPRYTAVVRNKRTGRIYDAYCGGPVLLRQESHKQLNMPVESLEWWPPGNCAEPKAINQALSNGDEKEDLELAVVLTHSGAPSKLCRNCTQMAFGLSVSAACRQRPVKPIEPEWKP